MFVDKVRITVIGGRGGDGAVAFHREKYVASGGPDGGDGGHGGSVILRVNDNLSTLLDFRYRRKYQAAAGVSGQGRKMAGKRGENLIIEVPRGTVVRDAETNQIIVDMSTGEDFILAKGGRGGWGNAHYATPTRQVPRFAKAGLKGQERDVILELKLLADVGLVGFPNVGKSTLLSVTSNAHPKIANYHFTTLSPNLGVVDLDGDGFVIADIPGLIEGASEGVGLGLDFLRHIERTKVIIQMVDAASVEGRDPIADIHAINKELNAYNPEIAARPQVIAANKIDAIWDKENDPVEKIRQEFEPEGIKVFPISAVTGQGLKELMYHVKSLLDTMDDKPVVFEQEFFPEDMFVREDLPYTVARSEEEANTFIVEGPRIEKMLGYTNLESEKGFAFFQRFLKDTGILEELEQAGIEEGDTVRMYGLHFTYYK